MTHPSHDEPMPFETLTERYDAWYDSAAGRVLFELELEALRPLLEESGHPRLEIGVGTGRFAVALGIEVGVDFAFSPLEYARRRGVRVAQGVGERLPFANNTFGTVVLIATLCFVAHPEIVVNEARRVLQPNGRMIIAFVPRDSFWGRYYQAMGRDGNPFYRDAHFYTSDEIERLLQRAGLTVVGGRSTLLQPPSREPFVEEARDRSMEGAGFVVLAVTLADAPTVDV